MIRKNFLSPCLLTCIRAVFLLLIFFTGLYGQNNAIPEFEALKKLIGDKKYDEAIHFIEITEPLNKKFDFYKLSADFFMRMGKYLKAIDYYKLAYVNAETSKDREYTLLKRGECYLNLRNYNEAKLIISYLIKDYPNTLYINDAYLLLAQAHEALGESREAMNYYQKLQPTLSAQIIKAKAFVRLNKFDEAVKIFEGIFKTEKEVISNNPDIYYYFGEALRNKRRFKEAKTYLSGAKRVEAFSEKSSLSLGKIAYDEKEFDAAIKYFNEVITGKDKEAKAEAYYYLGMIYYEKGEIDKAIEKLVKLRNDFPVSRTYGKATIILSEIMRQRGEYESAIKYLDELLKNNNVNNEVINEMEMVLNDISGKDEKMFRKHFDRYAEYLLKFKRHSSLIKYCEKVPDEKKITILNRIFLSGSNEDKKKSAILLFNYYLNKGELSKALKLEKYVDKALSDRIRIHDYLFDGNYYKALYIIEKLDNPQLNDLENLLYLERKLNDKKRITNILRRWINSKDLEWNLYVRIGDYFFHRDKSLALESYKKAYAKSITKENKREIEDRIIALQNNAQLPFVSENAFDEKLNKIREREKVVERIMKEYNL